MKKAMSRVLLLIVAIAALGGSHFWGYNRGIEDFGFLDHVLRVSNGTYVVNRCQSAADAATCYKKEFDFSVLTALVWKTQHLDKTSPLANIFLGGHVSNFETAFQRVVNYASANGIRVDYCERYKDWSDEHRQDCRETAVEVDELIAHSTPKESFPTPNTNSTGRQQ